MKNRYIQIRKARITRIIIILVVLFVLITILQKQSHIPVVEQNIDCKDKVEVVDIDIFDTYSKDIYFKMFDITKTKYMYHVEGFHRWENMIAFNHTTDNIDFSPVENVDLVNYGTHDMMLMPKEDKVYFYTRNVLAENIQTIRMFFLTELIIFFLTLLGHQLIKFIILVTKKETGIRQLYKNSKWLKYCLSIYLFGIILSLFVLYRINVIPVFNINEQHAYQNKTSLFDMHDISCSCYRIIPNNSEKLDYVFKSNQILAFVPLVGKPISTGPSQITYNIKRNEEVSFYTENLESKNIQDIRIFFVTTLLLGFIGRWLFYLKKLKNYKWEKL